MKTGMRKKLIIGALLAIAIGMPALAVYAPLAAIIGGGVLLVGFFFVSLIWGKKDDADDYLPLGPIWWK